MWPSSDYDFQSKLSSGLLSPRCHSELFGHLRQHYLNIMVDIKVHNKRLSRRSVQPIILMGKAKGGLLGYQKTIKQRGKQQMGWTMVVISMDTKWRLSSIYSRLVGRVNRPTDACQSKDESAHLEQKAKRWSLGNQESFGWHQWWDISLAWANSVFDTYHVRGKQDMFLGHRSAPHHCPQALL